MKTYNPCFLTSAIIQAYTAIGGDIMCFLKCFSKMSCTALSVLISLVAGVVAFVLTITGAVGIFTPFVWIGFGIAVAFLFITFLVAAFTDECDKKERGCICRTLSTLQFGALGAILTALVLLGVDFGGISVIGAIVYGALFFFFVLLITSLICLARCYADCRD